MKIPYSYAVYLFGLLGAGFLSFLVCLIFKEVLESRLLGILQVHHGRVWNELGKPSPRSLFAAGRSSEMVYRYHWWIWLGDYHALTNEKTIAIAKKLRRCYATLALIGVAELIVAWLTSEVLSAY